MSQKQKPALKSVEAAPPPAPPKKKKKPLLIVGILMTVLLGGGGAAWYFLQDKQDKTAPSEHEGAEKAKKLSLFVPLETFTVNLHGEEDHFLQIGLTLQVTDETTVDEIKQQMPLIRNRLLLLLSAKTPDDLATLEGKQKLAAQILAESRLPLSGKTEDRGIQNVLFSSFVIQ
jgi:flagellar FliL protein